MLLRVILLLLVATSGAIGIEIEVIPDRPKISDSIEIVVRGCTQPGTLHWGVNADGGRWQEPIREYRPPGSSMWGVAVRTEMDGPDEEGTCRVRLGPFLHPDQLVRSVNFAIHWRDGTWSNKDEQNYLVNISYGRITWTPEHPSVNDRILVRVQGSRPGGYLRWGVNSENDLWQTPHTSHWPKGTILAEDRIGVDTPLSRPDGKGVSTAVLGPFNRPEQVVRTLHLAAHWDSDWETDASRNYNLSIALNEGAGAPFVEFASPSNGEVIVDAPNVVLRAEEAHEVDMWLNGRNVATLREAPFELRIPFRPLQYGQHRLTARARREGKVGLQEIVFWKVPPHLVEAIPEGTAWGVTDHGDGTATFALHAPGKLFVSLVGDFNRWDPYADMMKESPDGTWWLTRALSNGTWKYQFAIEGRQRLADPYARDVEWKDASGREGYRPEDAKAVVVMGQPPFAWTATNFVRPPLQNLSIYEFHIDDLNPGQGFTGVIARLDYIQQLGFTAIEPLPFNEFTLDHSWGYNPSFHFAPESAYGTPHDLKRLIDETHRRGMAFISDQVLNHMDRNSALYQLYGSDYEASPFFRLFLGENWGFPDLDQTTRATKRYVSDLLQYWIREYRVDGYRYDATRWVEWDGYNNWGASWMAYAAKQADPTTYQIAEHLPFDPDLINRTEMDTGWGDTFHWPVKRMLTGAFLDRSEMERAFDPRRLGYSNAIGRVAYIESHDEERIIHELRDANFAREEREQRAALGLVLTLTAPGPVMIYSGQEFGEDTRKRVGSNPLQWHKLKVDPGRTLARKTGDLLRLRNTHPAMAGTDVELFFDGLPEHAFYYRRGAGPDSVMVAVNLGRKPQTLNVEMPADGTWSDVLNGSRLYRVENGRLALKLDPGQGAVLARQ